MIESIPTVMAFHPGRVLAILAAIAIWTATCVTAGYAWKAHRAEVDEAKHEGAQQAVQAPVTAAAEAIDTSALLRLGAETIRANNRAADLTRKLKEAANAHPAPADCRLPDGLRDEINRDLTGDQPEAADPLQHESR